MHRTRILVSGIFLAVLALSPAWAQGAGNYGTIGQQGRGNAAGIAQTGSGNAAGILQFGRYNTGVITQDGAGNTACLVQTGRNLDGAVQQVGDNQTMGVWQTPRGSREIPVETCANATTRREVMAYAIGRVGPQPTVRGHGRSVR
ncbi:hypothetical protein [Hyphomonas sp.]|uniref:hypothetical protein n=1 Tax=Hyphomonas sp. TaxID=87 RepID=UPI00349FDA1C